MSNQICIGDCISQINFLASGELIKQAIKIHRLYNSKSHYT